MFEQYESIISQFEIQVDHFKKGRGTILLDTDCGLKVLKEVQIDEERLNFIDALQKKLTDVGIRCDLMLRTKEGKYIAQDDNKKYIIKDWIEGREINLNDKNDVMRAVGQLTKMHKIGSIKKSQDLNRAMDRTICMLDRLEKHNRELIRIRNSIRKVGNWTEFELLFLETFELFYHQAFCAWDEMKKLIQNSKDIHKSPIHGQYHQHNVVVDHNAQVCLTNFEAAAYHYTVVDLYGMLRKILEKNDWDEKMGMDMIGVYHSEFEMSGDDLRLMTLLFKYPEKFWKISNYYSNLNKAWKPQQILIKLRKIILQERRRQNFITALETHYKIGSN